MEQRSPTRKIERGHESDHRTGEGPVTIRRHKVLNGSEPGEEQDGTDPESPDRGNQLKQRTTRGPDMRKREGDQYNPYQSTLSRECLSEQWTKQGPITRKRRGNQYSPDREGVSFLGSPERTDERRHGEDIGPTRDSLNKGGVSKKSPKIVKQEDGPSGSYQDRSDQNLEYVSKNWAKGPGARRRDKMWDSIEHLCKVICKLSTQVYKHIALITIVLTVNM